MCTIHFSSLEGKNEIEIFWPHQKTFWNVEKDYLELLHKVVSISLTLLLIIFFYLFILFF
jgi:hypothetical protein